MTLLKFNVFSWILTDNNRALYMGFVQLSSFIFGQTIAPFSTPLFIFISLIFILDTPNFLDKSFAIMH